MDTASFGRDVVGMFDARISELEQQLKVLRELRSMAATRLGIEPTSNLEPTSNPEPTTETHETNGHGPVIVPTQRRAVPEKRTRADAVAEVMEEFGVPVKIPPVLDVLIERGDGKDTTREKFFNAVYTALARSKKPDGSPRFEKVGSGTWWFADRPIPKDWNGG